MDILYFHISNWSAKGGQGLEHENAFFPPLADALGFNSAINTSWDMLSTVGTKGTHYLLGSRPFLVVVVSATWRGMGRP